VCSNIWVWIYSEHTEKENLKIVMNLYNTLNLITFIFWYYETRMWPHLKIAGLDRINNVFK